MRILITGGTGYLGSAIVRAFARAGHEVVVFARRATTAGLPRPATAAGLPRPATAAGLPRPATAAGLPGAAIDGDIRDRSAVERAVATAEAVCHTAALVSLWRPDAREFDAVNIGGLEHVLAACRAHGTRRILSTSSFLALPPAGGSTPISANDYQRTKVRALAVARSAAAAGLPIVTLFPGVVYGPGPVTEGNLVGRLIRDHLHGRLPGIVGGDRAWSYAWADDVADAHVAALTGAPGGSEYILGGVNAPQMQAFEIVRAVTGTPLPRRLPFVLASAAGMLEEMRARLTGRPPLVTRGAVEIFRHDWSLDSRRSVEELGLRVTPLENGVREVLREIA
jgi:farnesol dehydrogenase